MLEPVVFLVDDDHAIRDSLSLLLKSIGLKVMAFDNPQAFLAEFDPDYVGCLLLDIRLPGVDGFSVYEDLRRAGYVIPTIFITGHGDVAQCSRAFKAGAADFLTKPIDEQVLIQSLQKAIRTSITMHQRLTRGAEIQRKLNRLTDRETEVLRLIVDGHPNKLIARQLDVSTRTVESHRAKVFEKLEVSSLAECVKLHIAAGVNP